MASVHCRVVSNKLPTVERNFSSAANDRVARAAILCQSEARRRARVDTGRMRNSITAVQESPTSWIVGTNVEYAVYHEYGTTFMTAQPMFHPAIDIVRARIPGIYVGFERDLA